MAGDNSKFETDKKKLFNDTTITLPNEQSENLRALLDATEKDNLPYRTNDDDETLFKVKMIPDMRIMDKDRKPIRINIKDVPCIALRDFKEATVDIAINWGKQGIRNWRWWRYFFRNSYGYSDESYR